LFIAAIFTVLDFFSLAHVFSDFLLTDDPGKRQPLILIMLLTFMVPVWPIEARAVVQHSDTTPNHIGFSFSSSAEVAAGPEAPIRRMSSCVSLRYRKCMLVLSVIQIQVTKEEEPTLKIQLDGGQNRFRAIQIRFPVKTETSPVFP